MNDAELRALLLDCLALWGINGKITPAESGMDIMTPDGTYFLQRAAPEIRPVRWLLHTPARRSAGRPPRAAPSIGAMLSALRNALGAAGGIRLMIGPGGTPP